MFDAFVSKAFQIGLVMTVDYLAYADDGDRLTKPDRLLNALNDFSPTEWTAVLTELWPDIRPGISTDPKAWPAYRNILLRMCDEGEMVIFARENLRDSPDWRLCETLINQSAKAYFDTNAAAPPDTERKKRAKAAVEQGSAILQNCGLTPLWSGDEAAAIDRADAAYQSKLDDLAANG